MMQKKKYNRYQAEPVIYKGSTTGNKLLRYIKPMLATLVKRPFNDEGWLFEIKWDGYRAIAEKQGHKLKFYSRNGIDFSRRYPAIAEALKKLKLDFVLDGELVLFDNNGLPDFQKLQRYETGTPAALLYYVFDLLKLDDTNLESRSLTERKQLLKQLTRKNRLVRYCDHVEARGIDFFRKAVHSGLEGIIGKKKDSIYTEGKRSANWVKIKNRNSTEAVILGYTAPRGSRKHFGSLILGNRKGRRWKFRGHVGTGFKSGDLEELKKKMKPLETAQSPFPVKIPVNEKVTWVKPKLVADIAFTELTGDQIFRHPVFLRLRDEKNLRTINDESPGS